MNSRTMRRLAADHSALHSQPLPPNFLFAPGVSSSDDLTQLDLLLAGPAHTPFAAGVFALHLAIPTTYPQQPPTAHFRTPIFHPNVDPQSGGVCVETLKRDWDAKLTLRDILVVIGCLLIHPNPDSALNAEAGALFQDDFAAFARRAVLMTSIHAAVGRSLKAAVDEAQNRGQEVASEQDQRVEQRDFAEATGAPTRRRRLGLTARQSGTAASRRSQGSPSGEPSRSRRRLEHDDPHHLPRSMEQSGSARTRDLSPNASLRKLDVEDESMTDANQENDSSKSPRKMPLAIAASPRRPQGNAVPLGQLTMDDAASPSSSEGEPEYPPSPRKSPRKVRDRRIWDDGRLESSTKVHAKSTSNTTPPTNLYSKTLAPDSPFFITSASPRKTVQRRLSTPAWPGSSARPGSSGNLFGFVGTFKSDNGVSKRQSPSASEKKTAEALRRRQLDEKLWKLCGEDIDRWNRGDFDGEPFQVRGGRW